LVSSEVALKLRLVFIPALALVMEVEEAAALVQVTSVQVFGMEVLMVEVEVEMAKGDDS
jgi:hypothetical protein